MSDTMFAELGSGDWGDEESPEYDLENYGDPAVDEEEEELYGGLDEADAATERRRRQARQRQLQRRAQLIVARQRRAQLARRPRPRPSPARPATAAAAIQRTRADVQQVNLESKVQADALDMAVKRLSKRTTGTERTAAFLPLATQLQTELDKFEDDLGGEDVTNLIKGVVGYLPVAFLTPEAKGLRSPQIQAAIGGLGIVGISFLIQQLRKNGSDGVKVTESPGQVPVGTSSRFRTNRNGAVSWTSDDETVATVDAKGVVTGKKAGSTTITATLGDDFDKVPVTVFDPSKTPTK